MALTEQALMKLQLPWVLPSTHEVALELYAAGQSVYSSKPGSGTRFWAQTACEATSRSSSGQRGMGFT
jgi:hypothetical protein